MQDRFETFTVLVTGIARAIRRIKNAEMVEFHLKGPHVCCLYYLYKKGALPFASLTSLCDEDKANMSRTVEYLEQNGYILPRTAAKYRAPLHLSEKGIKVGARIAEKIDRVLACAGMGVSEEERTVLYESLTKIHENLLHVCGAYEKTDQ